MYALYRRPSCFDVEGLLGPDRMDCSRILKHFEIESMRYTNSHNDFNFTYDHRSVKTGHPKIPHSHRP
jgi:hypothetical protein